MAPTDVDDAGDGWRGAHYAALARSRPGLFRDADGVHGRWLVEVVSEALALAPDARLLDLGCGDGSFAQALHARARLAHPVVGVDDSEAALAAAAGLPGVTPVPGELAGFLAGRRGPFDAILMKEVIHHLPPPVLAAVFSGSARALAPGGRLLVVTRPVEVDYPFFAAARRRWREQQPDTPPLVAALAAAGLDAAVSHRDFPVRMEKQVWLDLVRSRFWSTFAVFDDAELAAGIAEIERRHAGEETLAFVDRIVLVRAQLVAPAPPR